ncbi:MAG: Ig-like domain-containing protein [Anaeromyxobacteraceae bacterium]
MKLRLAACSAALALLAACSNSTTPKQQPPPQPQVVSLAISVERPQVARGTFVALNAKALYDDQSLKDVTELATWSSADPAVIAIQDCRARGLALGSTHVAVAFGGKTASAALTVTAAVLDKLAIDPVPAIAKGLTRSLKVTGTFSDATTQDLTADAAWSSSAPDVAAVASGELQARGAGTATIRALSGTKSAEVAVTVTPAAPTRLAIDQARLALVEELSGALTASAHFTDGTDQDVSGDVVWSSSDEAILTVANGTVHAVAPGRADVIATMGALVAKLSVTVDAARLAELRLGATPAQLPKGRTADLQATGVFDNDSTTNLTAEVLWHSSDDAVATVSNAAGTAGRVTAIGAGEVTVSATHPSGKIATARLAVTPAVVAALEVAPAGATVPAGLKKAFTAMATYSDGTKGDVTSSVTWQTSDASKASISNASATFGVLSALEAGAVDVVAIDAATGVRGSAPFTVSAAELLKITIDEAIPTDLPLGLTRQFRATGLYTDDTVQDITNTVVWASSNDTAASIVHIGGDAGLASGIAAGTTTIKAESADSHLAASVQLTVIGAVVVKLDVSCDALAFAKGYGARCTAIGTFSDHTQRDVTGNVIWTSEKPEVARVSLAPDAGLVSTDKDCQVGKTRIEAVAATPLAAERIGASVELEVTDAVLTAIAVAPANPAWSAMPRWYPVPFKATGTFSDLTAQDLTGAVTWTVSDPAVAQVSNVDAIVRGQKPGVVDVVATKGPIVGRFSLRITNWDLARLVVSPAATAVAKGNSAPFTATGEYVDPAEGAAAASLDFTQLVTWITHDWPGAAGPVAQISNADGARGMASALAVGTTTVHAVDPVTGRCAEARLDVTAAVVTALRKLTPQEASVHKGLTQQFRLEALFSDGSSADVTELATWSSSDPSVATVIGKGLASAAAWGSATITATVGAFSSSATLVVPAMTKLEITPSAASLAKGTHLEQQLVVTGTYSDGLQVDLTALAALSSSDVTVVQLDASGAFGAGVGTATLTATVGGLSAQAKIEVLPAKLLEVRIVADSLELAIGRNSALKAIGTFTDGERDITATTVWDSSARPVAQVSNDLRYRGTVTALTAGQTTITAVDPGTLLYGSATVVVVPVLR